jgi:flagellar protein FlaI
MNIREKTCTIAAASPFCQDGLVPLVKDSQASPPVSDPTAKPQELKGERIDIHPSANHNTGYQRLVTSRSEPTPKSLITLLAVTGIATVTGIIVLFIDLPLVVMAVLGIVSLALFTLAVRALRRRHAVDMWLPDPSLISEPGSEISSRSGLAGSSSTVSGPARLLLRLPEDPSPSIVSRYWVEEPFAYLKIAWEGTEGLKYLVTEPAVTSKEKIILHETYARLRDLVIYDASEKDREYKFRPEYVNGIIKEFDPKITDEQLKILNYYLHRDLSGYGPLDPIMRDPDIEDINCNGYNLPVFVFHRKFGSLPTNIVFSTEEITQFVSRLAQKANKQVSLSNPMIDGTLPDGARVQITYSDVVSTKGSSFTIRKFRAEPMTPLDLLRYGTYSPETLAFLWLAIEHRKSLIIAGGTASGKTSTMNAVSLFIPQNAKIVSLEDTREIQLPHRNWLPTQTRELSVPGIKGGDIDLFSLLKSCMRQRPEYIIVGEVRGVEAQTLFQAMNTGHATLSTIHAGSVQEAINRLTHDPINVPPVMFTALDLVVVQGIYTVGKTRIRRCLSIHEIEVNAQGEIAPVLLYEWDIRTDSFRKVAQRSRVLEEIAFFRGWSEEDLERELKRCEEFFLWALEMEPPSVKELANAIQGLGESRAPARSL